MPSVTPLSYDELAHLVGDVADLEAAARAQASLRLEDLHSAGLLAGPVDGTVKLRDMRTYSYQSARSP